MPTPQATQIHIDQALTNFSQAYTNDEFVADQVMPMVNVKKRSDKWFVYGKEHFRYRDNRRAPGGLANEFNWTLSQSSFYAETRAERHLILDDDRMEADDPLNLEIDTNEWIMEHMTGNLEVDVANFMTNTANLTTNTALAGTSQWSDYVNSTPLVNLKTAKAAVRVGAVKRANTFVSPYEVSLVLADHPDTKDLIKYTDPKGLLESGLPPVVRGLRVVEPGAVQDTAVEGRAATFAASWGKNAIVMYLNPSPGLRKLGLAYRFTAPDPTSGTVGFATRQYRSEEKKGDYIEVEITYVLKMVAPGAGYLFATAIA